MRVQAKVKTHQRDDLPVAASLSEMFKCMVCDAVGKAVRFKIQLSQ
jgi:hypothetical protein